MVWMNGFVQSSFILYFIGSGEIISKCKMIWMNSNVCDSDDSMGLLKDADKGWVLIKKCEF